MKNSKFVFLCGAFIASAFTLGAYADDQANSAPAPAACANDCIFKLENFGFSETVKAYNFNDDSDNNTKSFKDSVVMKEIDADLVYMDP